MSGNRSIYVINSTKHKSVITKNSLFTPASDTIIIQSIQKQLMHEMTA